jgi:hypothetical protein
VSDETITGIDEIAAPYGRKVTLEDVEHESGLRLLRIRIREGTRFTVLDVDEDTATRWGTVMSTWARNARK